MKPDEGPDPIIEKKLNDIRQRLSEAYIDLKNSSSKTPSIEEFLSDKKAKACLDDALKLVPSLSESTEIKGAKTRLRLFEKLELPKYQYKKLRRRLTDFHSYWQKVKSSPRSIEAFLSGVDGPKNYSGVLQDLELDLGKHYMLIGSNKDREITEPDQQGYEKRLSNWQSLGMSFDKLTTEKSVTSFADKLSDQLVQFQTRINQSHGLIQTKDEAKSILHENLRLAIYHGTLLLSEGLELEFCQGNKINDHRRRWFLFRGMKGVFFYYIRTYLHWAIEKEILPDRSPATHLQKVAFRGFDFSEILEKFCDTETLKNAVKQTDPTDPVTAYSQMLWHTVLMSLGFHLLPGSYLANDHLDGDTQEFIEELLDYHFYFIQKNPADSAINIANIMKRRFIDV